MTSRMADGKIQKIGWKPVRGTEVPTDDIFLKLRTMKVCVFSEEGQRTPFLFHGKVRPMKQKRSAWVALRRIGICRLSDPTQAKNPAKQDSLCIKIFV